MKTIFDKATRDELIDRINALNETSTAQWGKMNVYQMCKHCRLWEEWIQGKPEPRLVYKQEFIGKIFGKIGMRRMLRPDKPMDRNVPTSKDLIIKEKEGDTAAEKIKWMSLIEGYSNYSNSNFIHDFFGKMTVEQIGFLAYKHNDHHLRQFGSK